MRSTQGSVPVIQSLFGEWVPEQKILRNFLQSGESPEHLPGTGALISKG